MAVILMVRVPNRPSPDDRAEFVARADGDFDGVDPGAFHRPSERVERHSGRNSSLTLRPSVCGCTGLFAAADCSNSTLHI